MILLKFQHDNRRLIFKAYIAPHPVRTSAFISTILSHKANLLSERYNYPACLSRQASLIQILKFYERPCIVPHEVIRLNVVSRALCVEIWFSGLLALKPDAQEACICVLSVRPMPYHPLD